MKRFWMAVLVGVLAFMLAGCNGKQDTTSTGDTPSAAEQSTPADDAIKIDDIKLNVEAGLDGRTRRAMFSYTNNSDYTVVSVELDLVFPEDIDTTELEEPFDYILEQDVSMEDLLESTMRCEKGFAAEPGETSRECTFDVYAYYVNNVEQYELMEPDMMVIRFLHNGLIYEEVYDYRSESYNLSSDTIDPEQWGEGDLSEAVPRPEDGYVIDTSEDDSRFTFEVSGLDPDAYSSYIDACKEAGYNVEVVETDGVYYADNEDGLSHIDFFYNDNSGSLTAYVDRIEEE